ncbi:MAG: ribonuclease P protein component [Patescibacteria group bacterium]
MLKKGNRISKNKEFDRVFKAGQSFYSKVLGFKAAPTDLDAFRLGVLINTKISKKAVVRNRFKRQIRQIIQNRLDKLKPGYDLVIIVLPLILDKNFQELEKNIETGLKRLNLYK